MALPSQVATVATLTDQKVSVAQKVILATAVLAIGVSLTGLMAVGILSQKKLVYLNPTVVQPREVVVGTKDVILAGLNIKNTSQKEAFITDVNFTINTAGRSPADISNFRLFNKGVLLPTVNDPDENSSTKTVVGDQAFVKFTLKDPLIIPAGTARNFVVQGDSSTSTPPLGGGTYQVGIGDNGLKPIFAYFTNSPDKVITPSYLANQGVPINFVVGNLSISRGADTPDYNFVPSGGLVNFLDLEVRALYEDIRIEKISFLDFPINGGGWNQIDSINVYVAGQMVASTSSPGVSGKLLVDFLDNPIIVPKDDNVTLTIKATTAALDPSGSFKGIKIGIDSAIASGVQSGIPLPAKGIVIEDSYAYSNPMYVVKSVPVVFTDEIGGEINPGTNVYDLYEFDVYASFKGAVGLDKVSFNILPNNVNVSNLELFTIAWSVQGNTTTPGVVDFTQIGRIIAPGTSGHFVLRGNIECDTDCVESGGSVVVQFLGDTALPSPLPHVNDPLMTDNFVWTDFSKDYSMDSSSRSADQWSNGYLVKKSNGANLDATSSGAIWQR